MIELLQHWKLAAVVLLVFGSYVKGCTDEKGRHEETMATFKRIGEEQEKRSKKRSAELKAAKTEVEAKHEVAITERSERYAALYARWSRLHNDPGPRIMSGGTPGANEPVQPSGKKCFDTDRLDTRITEDLRRYGERVHAALSGLAEVVRRGEEGLDDSVWWGRWATKIGACKS